MLYKLNLCHENLLGTRDKLFTLDQAKIKLYADDYLYSFEEWLQNCILHEDLILTIVKDEAHMLKEQYAQYVKETFNDLIADGTIIPIEAKEFNIHASFVLDFTFEALTFDEAKKKLENMEIAQMFEVVEDQNLKQCITLNGHKIV